MKYEVMSRKRCEKYCTQNHKDTSIIISIKSSWDKEIPNLFIHTNGGNNVKDILFLSFDDIDLIDCIKANNTKGLITEQQANKIVEFVDKWYNHIDKIIVHCDGGISRSTGICSAIMRWYENEDYKYFYMNTKWPNMTCYLTLLDAFRGISSCELSKGDIRYK